jgi:uncharacterized protein (AIM24 family)
MTGYANQPPPPPAAAPPPRYTCGWCGWAGDLSSLSCPACGAPVDVRVAATASGWYELPGIVDMARLQFGNSYCQIAGTYVPVADMDLAAGDGVYFTHHVLLWKDPQVAVGVLPMRGGWTRVFAGLPLVMTRAHGPGHVAFSKDAPGELIALPLQAGQSIDVREHVFMVATGQVAYDWFQTGIWFSTKNGDDVETFYPLGQYMDRFTAPQQPGLLLLHGAGNAFVRRLGQRETILVKPTALLFKDASVRMQLHLERPRPTWRSWRTWGERYLWVRLHGPGRVAVQSAFKHLEDPGYSLYRSSPMTSWQW